MTAEGVANPVDRFSDAQVVENLAGGDSTVSDGEVMIDRFTSPVIRRIDCDRPTP
jgi:hypothetical protein